MKANRRILAVATMALSAALIAGPAHAAAPPRDHHDDRDGVDIIKREQVEVFSQDCSTDGVLNILNNVLSCLAIEDVLSND